MIYNNIKSHLAISGSRLTSLPNNYIILNVYKIVGKYPQYMIWIG